MMRTIYKQVIQVTDVQVIKAPTGSQFLSVQVQHGLICVWYICDPEKPEDLFKISIAGTGHDIKHCEGMRFLGTVQPDDGYLVFHVFVE